MTVDTKNVQSLTLAMPPGWVPFDVTEPVTVSINGQDIRGPRPASDRSWICPLRRLGDTWGEEAEAAFSVETVYQDQGIGSDLMGRIVRAARNRGIRRLYMSCLAENSKMQAIARKHEADLRFEYGEVIGEIMPDTPNYFSIMAEAAEDRVGFMIAVLELQSRMVRAA